MVEAVMSTSQRLAPLFLALLSWPSTVFAHQLDEYLQATLVTIEPGEIRLEINLTPGVAVAGQVLAVIDQNADGVISTNEAAAYGERLKRDLVVRLDGRKLGLKLTDSNFPALAELRTGWKIIQMEFSARPVRLRRGSHALKIENRHLPGISAYLCNAAQPTSSSVSITGQKRNKSQSESDIGFTITNP